MSSFSSLLVRLRLGLFAATGTVVCYLLVCMMNCWLFGHWDVAQGLQGIAWVYLPAGVRLICTLLFAEAGAVGLLIGSMIAANIYAFFPGDPITTFGYGVISALSPYLAYKFTLREMALQRSLSNLTSTRFMACILLYGLTNPLLQLMWFSFRGISYQFWYGLMVMSIGDLTGSLIVVYAIKILLSFIPLPPARR